MRSGTRLILPILVGVFLLTTGLPLGTPVARADTTVQTLPFTQNWTNTAQITVTNDWSGVPGIIGYRGDAMVGATGVDPQTVVADGSATPVNVLANQLNPNTLATGGVAEFDAIPNPVVALQGSGTARAPHLVMTISTAGKSNVNVAYTLRDVDGSADNAIQQVALQYRVGTSGSYTNLPAGYVADATTGGAATLVTPVSVPLPGAAENQPTVQVRVLTTDAIGSDEWVGVDDISVTADGDQAPFVQSTSPSNGATEVALASNIGVTFSEAVTASGAWFGISCTISGSHSAAASGGPTSYSLDPDSDFVIGETCTVTIVAANVGDQDAFDPPDNMAADHVFSFSTVSIIPPGAGDVVISEVYGGGGNAGATLKNDFIELYNRTAATISLNGWSVQYASATGSSWQVTNLSGSIASGGYYLIREAAGAGGTVDLPPHDASGGIAMAGGAGKVAVLSSTAALTGTCPTGGAIIDFVGYGSTANCFEGSGPTATLSNTTSAQRLNGGATDTNNNTADFVTGSPDPRGSVDPAPSVSATSPANGGADVQPNSNITITFSEAVNVSGSWFSISCSSSGSHSATASGGPVTFSLDPDFDFAQTESCTVTVNAGDVSDQDAFDPPDNMAANYVFGFTTADLEECGEPGLTFVNQIQGSGATSGMTGSVRTIEAIVVGDYQGAGSFSGFYAQEEDSDADADAMTSEGIFVFSTATDVGVGDAVRVRGTVTEFGNVGATLTELTAVSFILVCDSGNALPSAAVVGLPVSDLSVWERSEGMRIGIGQTLTVTETFTLGRFGEVLLAQGGRLFTPTNVVSPGAPAAALQAQNNLRKILLDDGNNEQNIDPTIHPVGGLSASNTLRSGYTLPSIGGVLDQRFGAYRIQPTGPVSFNPTNARTASPDPVGGSLKVASFNVLNYFNGDGLGGGFPTSRGAETAFEFDRQRTKIIAAITALDADVVGLMELENDSGPNSAIADLVAGLNDETAPGTYTFVDTGVVGTDAIRVGLIYRPGSVTPVGGHAILNTAVDARFIDTRNRPALAQTFAQNSTGSAFTVVVNHLKSKGSPCDPDDPDGSDGQGNCNGTRVLAAQALIDWMADDPTGSSDPDFLVIGDLNSYAREDPITEFENAGYTNLIRAQHGDDAYSYVFDGQSGYLDHALANSSLTAQVTGVSDWHINADEPIALDYNTNFKTANHVNTLFAGDAYRSSDHDPVLIGLDLDAGPTITSLTGPTSPVRAGTSAAFNATFTDPNPGETHTSTWDWGDGSPDTVHSPSGGSDSASHTYAAAGFYIVTLTVTDDSGLSDTETLSVIVFDPAAGHATGSGTYSDGSFNFSAKYNKAGTSLSGTTQLNVNGMTFVSSAYQWLVVSGNRATFSGTGTLNGVSGYSFVVSVLDGGSPGINDRIRVQISQTGGPVVYDSQPGDPISAVPTSIPTSGNITVHKPK
ncbi:MAG: ExeM/NucH family extracellular endonuclease [Chloroflexota bacterium]